MGIIREVQIEDKKLLIHELDYVYDSVTGCALTGSWVWDSALHLSQWITTRTIDFRDKTVVELGAGAGLPGLTAALVGANRVVLTDIQPLLPGLKRNVEANGLGHVVHVSQLVWGINEFPSQLSELGEVDVVLMSDVFFDAAEMAALAKTLRMVWWEGIKIWAATEIRPWTSDVLGELVREGFDFIEMPSELSEFGSSVRSGFPDNDFVVFQLVLTNKQME